MDRISVVVSPKIRSLIWQVTAFNLTASPQEITRHDQHHIFDRYDELYALLRELNPSMSDDDQFDVVHALTDGIIKAAIHLIKG